MQMSLGQENPRTWMIAAPGQHLTIFRVKRLPFSPSGEKVADRPDEGAFEDGSIQKTAPLTPALSPNFLRVSCHATPRSIRKK